MKTNALLLLVVLAGAAQAQKPDTQAAPSTAVVIPPPAPKEATPDDKAGEVFLGLKEVAKKNYDTWQKQEKLISQQLSQVKDYCNNLKIDKLVNQLRGYATEYFKAQREYVVAWTENNLQANIRAAKIQAASDPLIDDLEADVKSQETELQVAKERLAALSKVKETSDIAESKQVLTGIISVKEDRLKGLRQSLQERKKIQENTKIMRENIQLKIDYINEQRKLVDTDEANQKASYDSIVSQFALRCTELTKPIEFDFRRK